jgi:stage II sporulation protein E
MRPPIIKLISLKKMGCALMDKPSVIPFEPRMHEEEPSGEPAKGRRPKLRFQRRSKPERPGAATFRTAGIVQAGRAVPAWKEAALQGRWIALAVAAGFLLGRAVMLDGIAPFAAAYFGVMLYLRRELAFWAALAAIAGSFWAPDPSPAAIFAEIGIVYLLHRGLEAYERADLSHAPVVVFVSVLLVRLFVTIMTDKPSWLPILLNAIEAGLAFVLTMLFLHAVPVLTRTRKASRLRHEEWIGLMILAASLLTGMAGWSVLGVSGADAAARYLVLLFAMAGGPAFGTSVGVVTGIILSLSDSGSVLQISLLAFGGLMAGLLREHGKSAAVFGLLLGTSVLALYSGQAAETMASVWASVAASLLLLATPSQAVRHLAQFVPGTPDYARSQREYAQKVRDLTAERVERFSAVFRQLSRSFRQMTQAGETARLSDDFHQFVNAVHDGTCARCHRRQMCWDNHFFQTYKLLTDLMGTVEEQPEVTLAQLPKEWSRHCVKLPKVLEVTKRQHELYRHDQQWRRQLQDSRLLVADQLTGVSQVMDDLVKEIRREAQELSRQEEQIRDALDGLGLAIQGIEIVSLEEGRVEIEIVHAFRPGFDESRKVIAPLLSDILGEAISVRSERRGTPAPHLTTAVFATAKAYEVSTGVAGAAKDGDLLSGDTFSMVELGSGKFAVALSDGMGNGMRARMESSAALSMLEQLLQSGIDERLAIKSVNSVLLLRSPEEMFATVDLALIDLHSARATLLKIGSTPSYIKRGREVIPVAANNLPIGILQDIEVDLLEVQLQPGDTLVMMTDGVLDAPGHAVNKEVWMKRVLQELDASDPQELAEALLETAQRQYPGAESGDDMTVVVTRIARHQPEWAAFRWPGVGRVERPRTVS